MKSETQEVQASKYEKIIPGYIRVNLLQTKDKEIPLKQLYKRYILLSQKK